MHHYLSYDFLAPAYVAYLAAQTSDLEPSTYHEAAKDPRWVTAMQQEVQALEDNGTWVMVDLPPGQHVIGCKWVFKIKYKASGEVERFKARLVAKGFSQKEGLDYTKTFYPMAKMVTVRSVLAVAAQHSWHIYQMDVFNAFLQGDLLENVYMHLPPGFGSQHGHGKVCKLQKSLYGLKQASRQWNLKLTHALQALGFVQSHFDYSLFTLGSGSDLVVVFVYVDDFLVTDPNPTALHTTRSNLQQTFKIKDLGELRFFLGIEFARNASGILMNQRKYALELLAASGQGGVKPVSTPMDFNQRLTSHEFDEVTGSSSTDPLLEDVESYQRLVGRLLYLTMTRPDIAYIIQVLSQFMHKPKQSHMTAALRVIKYIKNAPGLGLFMSSEKSQQLVAYCDSDWAACLQTKKSVTGYMVKYGQSLISWKSKKQETISRSLAEAEFRSMASTVAELSWLTGLFKELEVLVVQPVDLYCDSKAAIQIAVNPIFHERTKHIDIDCHFVREKLQEGLIRTHHINTKEQPADVFTKGLGKAQHHHLLSKLGVKNVFLPSSLRGSVDPNDVAVS